MGEISQDLYPYILCHLSPSDLAMASRVSRIFHFEASIILYCNIDLLDSTVDQILSWAYAVARNPRLGRLVRTLCLQGEIPPQVDVGGGHEVLGLMKSALTKAFGAIVSLSSLKTVSAFNGLDTYLTMDQFRKGTFRLRTFLMYQDLDRDDRVGMISFLSEQSEIEHLSFPKTSVWSNQVITTEMLPDTLLPRLSVFETVYQSHSDFLFLKFVTSKRALVRLAITIHTGWVGPHGEVGEVLGCVSQCHHSLRYFWLREDDGAINGFTTQIGEIAKNLPRLRFLCYSSIDNTLQVGMISSMSAPSTSFNFVE